MILIDQTFEIVTPKSAEEGDAAERGFNYVAQPFTFREMVELLQEHPQASSSGSVDPSVWFSSYPDTGSRAYFEQGEEESTAVHFSRENPPRLAKYWAKAARFAAAKNRF